MSRRPMTGASRKPHEQFANSTGANPNPLAPSSRAPDSAHRSPETSGASLTSTSMFLPTFVGSGPCREFRAYFADVAPGRSGGGGATLDGLDRNQRHTHERLRRGVQHQDSRLKMPTTTIRRTPLIAYAIASTPISACAAFSDDLRCSALVLTPSAVMTLGSPIPMIAKHATP